MDRACVPPPRSKAGSEWWKRAYFCPPAQRVGRAGNPTPAFEDRHDPRQETRAKSIKPVLGQGKRGKVCCDSDGNRKSRFCEFVALCYAAAQVTQNGRNGNF